jgi:hypothetical protein
MRISVEHGTCNLEVTTYLVLPTGQSSPLVISKERGVLDYLPLGSGLFLPHVPRAVC